MLPIVVLGKDRILLPAPPGHVARPHTCCPCHTVKGLQLTLARDQPVPEKAQVVGALVEVVGLGRIQGDGLGHGGKVRGRAAQEPCDMAAFQLI